jgi:hypothetical protein
MPPWLWSPPFLLGPSEVAIAEITGCPAEFVSVIAARLRASGVWTDAAVEYADWFAPGNLGIAHFTLDLETAAGTYVRSAKGSDGRYGYTLVAEGLDATRDEEWDGAGCPDPESSID